ncbi:hypothetical protein F441_11118 [Phytophthora nicotianae CJ01A1]|uniref:Uncharacterized protein n=4 Tax=Phytophthora nicotianae TaxID=4792 RepID=V9EZX0_PHYNI|nr:hypothetical protein F443_11207 [Phytophthora nicotianae P1569]ETL90632.1 hypothetical protein L917_10721 [Phytophthora nicotianae]ETM43940.1 hypothetical protein L914_10762 [Phytophthora nicotianae]ETP13877.1 hypothetical protein F441_11118 [Phytophthora nicotianae CJ01A1]ETP41949.1 hypothetical protein F442_11111 [Phytophthora nicotianae P10297]
MYVSLQLVLSVCCIKLAIMCSRGYIEPLRVLYRYSGLRFLLISELCSTTALWPGEACQTIASLKLNLLASKLIMWATMLQYVRPSESATESTSRMTTSICNAFDCSAISVKNVLNDHRTTFDNFVKSISRMESSIRH